MRFKPSEYRRLQAIAESSKKSVTDFVRGLVLRAVGNAPPEPEVSPELVDDFGFEDEIEPPATSEVHADNIRRLLEEPDDMAALEGAAGVSVQQQRASQLHGEVDLYPVVFLLVPSKGADGIVRIAPLLERELSYQVEAHRVLERLPARARASRAWHREISKRGAFLLRVDDAADDRGWLVELREDADFACVKTLVEQLMHLLPPVMAPAGDRTGSELAMGVKAVLWTLPGDVCAMEDAVRPVAAPTIASA